ncbi:hypothetical protein AMEX_G11749 [Astyanax mexicanus]|uniref:Uncharacterized protein n=1 Tax=Astyanax mexicanus TaxID=7994 RepID=A0A8T2LR59_ASTMX|nr:hypothetical protein AMEX_G11749 [Astyanax mexicanus]
MDEQQREKSAANGKEAVESEAKERHQSTERSRSHSLDHYISFCANRIQTDDSDVRRRRWTSETNRSYGELIDCGSSEEGCWNVPKGMPGFYQCFKKFC